VKLKIYRRKTRTNLQKIKLRFQYK